MPTPPGRRQRRAGGLSDALGRADIAAEFLRRNRTYRAEHTQMQQRIADGAVAKNARRSGVRAAMGVVLSPRRRMTFQSRSSGARS